MPGVANAALQANAAVHRAAVTEARCHDGPRAMLDRRGPVVLLHGDPTLCNILDGRAGRGLVAIDPAPCLGDIAFDAVDLILWQADDMPTI